MKKCIIMAALLCTTLSAMASEIATCKNSEGKTVFSLNDYSFTYYYGIAGRMSFATKYRNASGIVEAEDGFFITGMNPEYNLNAVALINTVDNIVDVEVTGVDGEMDVITMTCADLEVNL